MANSKVYAKLGNGTVRDLTLDTDTRVSVINNLTSTSTTAALSANQGRLLNQSVSNGKNQVANAITDKGVAASGSDSFATLASKIGQIKSGIRTYPFGFPVDVRQFDLISSRPPVIQSDVTISEMGTIPASINYLSTIIIYSSGWGRFAAYLVDLSDASVYYTGGTGIEGGYGSYPRPTFTKTHPGSSVYSIDTRGQVGRLYVCLSERLWAVNSSSEHRYIISD